MTEQDELKNQIQALLELHRKNRPVWIVLIAVMLALLILGVVQLVVTFKILGALKLILTRLSSS